MGAHLNSNSRYETGALWSQYKSLVGDERAFAYAAALAGAATKGNTGVERILG